MAEAVELRGEEQAMGVNETLQLRVCYMLENVLEIHN